MLPYPTTHRRGFTALCYCCTLPFIPAFPTTLFFPYPVYAAPFLLPCPLPTTPHCWGLPATQAPDAITHSLDFLRVDLRILFLFCFCCFCFCLLRFSVSRTVWILPPCPHFPTCRPHPATCHPHPLTCRPCLPPYLYLPPPSCPLPPPLPSTTTSPYLPHPLPFPTPWVRIYLSLFCIFHFRFDFDWTVLCLFVFHFCLHFVCIFVFFLFGAGNWDRMPPAFVPTPVGLVLHLHCLSHLLPTTLLPSTIPAISTHICPSPFTIHVSTHYYLHACLAIVYFHTPADVRSLLLFWTSCLSTCQLNTVCCSNCLSVPYLRTPDCCFVFTRLPAHLVFWTLPCLPSILYALTVAYCDSFARSYCLPHIPATSSRLDFAMPVGQLLCGGPLPVPVPHHT